MGDPLHEIAVAADEIREVVDDAVPLAVEHRTEMRLGHREANRIPNTLAQRTGRRLDPRSVAVLRMARRLALPLSELLQIIEREIVTAQVERTIDQHRCVSRGQHESIAIGPLRI